MMCGRFVLKTPSAEIARLFGTSGPLPNMRPRYNVAPTQDVLAVRFDAEKKERSLDTLRWGLIPFWAKDTKLGYSMINAKAETVTDKPAYRDAFKSRRCLIAADGFYEWKKLDAKTKQPYAITMVDGAPFAFAGLWDRWTDKGSGETIRSCTILTTTPNEVCAPIHDRMPVILHREHYDAWLGVAPAPLDELPSLLRPYSSDAMMAFPVATSVGNVRNDGPELLVPLAAQQALAAAQPGPR